MAPPRTVDLPIDLAFVVPRLGRWIVVTEACWEWTGEKTRDGYGTILVPDGKGGQRRERVHRLVYRLLVGPIGPFPLHHKVDVCHNPACCRPDHLERLTDEEHGQAHRKPECAQGHALVGHNVIVRGDGRPRCRTCANERSKRYGRAKSTFARGAHKTHCKYGHTWIPENIYTKPSTGHRECRLCIKARTERLKVR